NEPFFEAGQLDSFGHKKRILVFNKIDLRPPTDPFAYPNTTPPLSDDPSKDPLYPPSVSVSCVTGEGIETLKDEIKALVWKGEVKAEMLEVMINSRHQDALNRARAATLRTVDALRSGQTLELVALDLRIAV